MQILNLNDEHVLHFRARDGFFGKIFPCYPPTHISLLTDQPWSYQKPSLCSFSQRLIFCGGADCDYYANCCHYSNQNQLGCKRSATLLSPKCQDHRAYIKLARWYQQNLQVFINRVNVLSTVEERSQDFELLVIIDSLVFYSKNYPYLVFGGTITTAGCVKKISQV